MTDPAILSSDPDARLLGEAMDAIGRRAALPGGAAREDLDRRLVIAFAHLARPLRDDPLPVEDPPPRPVAVAMALTLLSQPHLIATFGRPNAAPPTDRPAPTPTLIPTEPLGELLGLARWELDELQGEVDRRVSLQLKQHRILSWLWSHFGLPEAGVASLVEVLFPGLRGADATTIGLSRRGGQLYALVDQPRAPDPASLYLSWVDRRLEGAIPPRGTFSARYVDPSLLDAIARGVGAEAGEVVALLDRAVTVVPRARAAAFLGADRWRSLAYESLTGLAGSYPRGSDLLDPIPAHRLGVDGWLRRDGDGVVVDNGKALFDSLALERAGEVARQLHAHLVASCLHVPEEAWLSHDVAELVRYDVARHLRAALTPLVDWARCPATAAHLATRRGGPRAAADDALARLAQTWQRHLDTTWTDAVRPDRAPSVAARLTAQVLRTRQALGQLWDRAPILGQEHREAAALFAAHYFAEAPLDRLWSRDREALAEDPVGRWFWPVWTNLLYARDDDDSTADRTFSF